MKNVKINSVDDVQKLLLDKDQLAEYLFALIKEVESLREYADYLKKNFKPRLRL